MIFFNNNDYDTDGKVRLYSNAKDAFMTPGVDNVSLFALKDTYFNKLYAQSTYSHPDYGMLQIMPDCTGIVHGDMYAAGGMFIVKYSMPTGQVNRAQWHNPASSISTVYATRSVSSNGNYLFGVNGNFTTFAICKWNLSSPWNFGSLGNPNYTDALPAGGTAMTNIYNVQLSLDGTKMFVLFDIDGYQPFIKRYDLSSAWQPITASYVSEVDLSAKGLYVCRYFNISPDGTSLYVMHQDMTCTLFQWKMTAWDITTTSTQYTLDVANTMNGDWAATRFTIDPIFRRMWISGLGSAGYNVKYFEQ